LCDILVPYALLLSPLIAVVYKRNHQLTGDFIAVKLFADLAEFERERDAYVALQGAEGVPELLWAGIDRSLFYPETWSPFVR
jgi:hypothetical protein